MAAGSLYLTVGHEEPDTGGPIYLTVGYRRSVGPIYLTVGFNEPEIPFGPEHPSVGPYTRRLYAALAQFVDGDEVNDWAMLRLCHAVGQWFDPIEELVSDSDDGPGWSALLDVERCPDWALPFLAQLVGVRLTQGASATVWREEIREHAEFDRGTPAAIRKAAARHLTGSRRVTLVERHSTGEPGDDPPYQLLVITYEAETPDPDAVLAELVGGPPDYLGAKPAGIRLIYRVDPGWSYLQLAAAHDTYDDVAGAFDTYAELRSNLPTP